ncbi:hypothetical protein ASG49_04205 [Marmoricola sp. Leaf446]|uniref:SAV_915 family protein n=1 Tax=Marmoricola sp. Leaf446 TaxID=1736379 RepID=UPI0006FF7367|nr:SAV_915 family protein [Marmoricola sp. Leaf446]KQT94120.1 hypothetical protein ASG49_04205 [Marmoricola sp. Leaf446]
MESPDSADRPLIPPVVYLPCRAPIPGADPTVEMRRLEDGRVALLLYTALDRLARCCGDDQPWALYRTEDLDALQRDTPFDVVMVDQELPAHLRHDRTTA